MSYQAAPPLVIERDEAYALLKVGEDTALAHYVREADDWVKKGQIAPILGPGAQWPDELRWADSLLSMSAFVAESGVRLRPYFARVDGQWKLSHLTMLADAPDDALSTSHERILRPEVDGFSVTHNDATRYYKAQLPPDDLTHFVLADWVKLVQQAMGGEESL